MHALSGLDSNRKGGPEIYSLVTISWVQAGQNPKAVGRGPTP